MKCNICGCEFEGWGNNPYPVRTNEDARCCNHCNDVFVLPARITMLSMNEKEVKAFPRILNTLSYNKLISAMGTTNFLNEVEDLR